ncbi:hypothetical protein MVLG_06723 [Microbotryum lychnidis-dioicae p1A1 Lamole]|uniref:Sulfatase N-terminal domain-containing protein n=1 Tax=Microbotryum lychnidis-dioicae (strain p1A1 Lamole / MvSl-1064) TaxID=683840 RepID=U5HI56_USTV1|nr:hypothetical protein MVLG_06723 [Microbotryum lychnidis-dioicae p1A1 Lamole]|eukprot:KDE02755.1 hypothetical protein MVLG_06723 [Microbotryum lychnidis-dioicae p1A1 Lamole]
MRGTHTSLLALLLVLLLPVARTALQSSSGAAAAEQVQGPRDDSTPSKHKPNIVLIIVDDQDAVQDSISTMKAVQRLLVQEGTSFERFFAPVSLCCPSRTSFLRAQAAHNTNITSVIAPWGGWGVFCEKGYNSHYLPSFMQSAGYSTRYVGKLMNGHNVNNYEALAPAGFTDADFLLDPQTYNYVNASFGRVGSPVQYHAGSYSTDLVKEKALHMIRDASHQRKPFFVVIAPIAPHSHIASLSHDVRLEAPVSAPRHAHLFKDVTLNYSRASHNPSSPSGASWVRQLERLNQTHVAYIEEFYRQRLRSLQAVDELVEAVVNELNKHNKSDDTIIIYTSDNGFEANGGHRRNPGKTLPYEEDIRIPFVVRGPGVPKGVVDSKSVYSLADLGATIMHLAGAKSDYEHDGSLVPLTKALRQDAVREGIKQHHLAEYWVDGIEEGKYSGQSERCRSFLNTTYRAIRIVEGNLTDLSYAVWCTGEHEIYDLRTDPDQMHNLAEVQSQSPELQKLLTRLDALLLVLKTCVGEVCKRPWKEMFPREDIRSLKDALDVKYDQYFRQLPKVTYSIQPTSIHRSHGMEHIWLPDGHRIPEIGYGSWLIGSGSTVVDQILAHFVCLGNDIAIQKQSSQLVSEPTKNQHQDDGAEDHDVGDKDNDDDDAEKENKNKAKAKEDLNRAKRSFTHVAAVGETKAGNESGAKDVLLGRLSALLATPIREHAIGFTLRDNRLKVYVMAACGVFFTKLKTVTKENGELSTFLYRLIKHSDRLNEFSGGATTMSNVKIEKLLFRQRSACGRATSTYEITTGEGTSCKTRAMTITWVLGLHDSYLADIRNFIKEKRPRGLAPLVGFFRTEYRTLLAFLPGDESFEFRGVVPRAKEVIVHEECYKSLATVKDTKELARILEGVIQGHRELWNEGFIHRTFRTLT